MGDRLSCSRHPRETTYTACAVCVSEEERAAIAEGRRLERAAIVAWLRQAQAVPNEYEEGRRDAMWDASERIARGEHEKGEDK